LGRGGSESILNPPPDEPILSVALRTGFVLLAESPREIVIGRAVVLPAGGVPPSNPDEFLATISPGWATDEKTERRFALYWWTIRLGSGLIRRMWLRAIRRRAERIGS
jgi:hypothetical protein